MWKTFTPCIFSPLFTTSFKKNSHISVPQLKSSSVTPVFAASCKNTCIFTFCIFWMGVNLVTTEGRASTRLGVAALGDASDWSGVLFA